MSIERPALYLVATPIGNLADFSPRGQAVLGEVDLILCEDTRTSRRLTGHFQIATPLKALHEHNEEESVPQILEQMKDAREAYALISDAGTPAISDPGYRLVRAAHREGIPVFSVPGACAAIAGLAASGLPTDRFAFEGFLPPKEAARRSRLEGLVHETRTLVFLESCHRIESTLDDMIDVFGGDRPAAIAREITKLHEQTCCGTLSRLRAAMTDAEIPVRGEFVLVVGGGAPPDQSADARRLLAAMLPHMPMRQAAKTVAGLTGMRPNELYALAETLRDPAAKE